MRIDLHVHSKHSTRPSQWILQKMGCPESFVEPALIYRKAREAGMDLVTISDHNTIDGALEIAHLPGAFISEEITSFFPEDGCKVHVLAWDIDEAAHRDIQDVRMNVHELVPYLQGSSIRFGVAHPLYGVNDKLTVEHFEKMLLLFKNFEVNGTRDDMQNNALKAIVAMLTPEIIAELADKHGMEPVFDEPWKKNLTGGSDDHSGLNICRMYTEVEGATDLDGFFQGLAQGRSRAMGLSSSPKTMAHNLYAIAYQFLRQRYGLGAYVNKDRLFTYLDTALTPESTGPRGPWTRLQALLNRAGLCRRSTPASFSALVRAKAEEVFLGDPDLRRTAVQGPPDQGRAEEEWYSLARRTSDRVLSHYADNLLDEVSGANLFNIFQSLSAAGALHTLLGSYFVSYGLFTKDRAFCRRALESFTVRLGHRVEPRPIRLVHFTDTFFETNGVAMTIQEQLDLANQTGKSYNVITCSTAETSEKGVANFTPVGSYDLPEYPELKLAYPPLLDMLSHVYENQFTHVHLATPGPVGLAGLLIAKLLRLPVHGTYHTAFPQYCRHLTGDETMEEAAWRYMVWFHNMLDRVFVPSRVMGEELAAKGIHAHKIRTYPRGIDAERFTPAKRNGFYSRYNLNGSTKLLYVGRVSREKNLDLLEAAFRKLQRHNPHVDLVVVGDGPYRAEMERNLKGCNCLFTGKLEGDDLAAAYASSDLFVFPSTTDTFGRVILEAQASGLPVIVTDTGGPQENMAPGETGLIVSGNDPQSLFEAMDHLTADPGRLRAMGRSAREFAQARTFQGAFEQTWRLYAEG